MGRSPCCSKEGLNRGAWTAQEDKILKDYISVHGQGKWRNLPQRAGLKRCGKSCRLRWLNYLRPDIKRGNISPDEEELIIRLHNLLGNRWSLIAGRLPGRTDNEIKNYWNTNLGKKVNTTSTSSAQQQQIEKINNSNNMEEAKDTPSSLPLLSPSNKSNRLGSHSLLVHTKASKCSKMLLVDPLIPHSSPNPLRNKPNAEHEADHDETPQPTFVDSDDKIMGTNNNVLGNGNLLSSFPNSDDDDHKVLSTDLLLDFDIGDCLPDLLNSDFWDVCDFGYNNNNNNNSSDDLLPFPDQLLLSSNEILKDRITDTNFCDEKNVVDDNFCEEW